MGYDLMARPCDQCLLSAQKIVSDVRRRQILAETARKDYIEQEHETEEQEAHL